MKEKILISWSGGKDSALALYEVKKSLDYEIAALLTVVTKDYDRVSMHGIRSLLLDSQADALGLPVERIAISKSAPKEEYESKMAEILLKYKRLGVASVAFGDIFLEDVRKYRQEKLSKIGMKAFFPLWKKDTYELASAFVRLGFKAIISCVDSKYLPGDYAGRIFDDKFLADLPRNIDPCGENGEFHSFVCGGPIFEKKISYKIGDISLRDNRFYYCDILPA